MESETEPIEVVIAPLDTWSWTNTTIHNMIEEKNYPIQWADFFERKDVKDSLESVSRKIEADAMAGKTIYPSPELVFRTFTLPIEKIRLVIVGQDVYFNGSAVGLCFSVPPQNQINSSLQNIYTELENEGYAIERTGDISHWHKQGCFMYNVGLTTTKDIAGAHLKEWQLFSKKVLEEIAKRSKNTAWLLMGSFAQAYADTIKNYPENEHEIFVTTHPSGLSASKPSKNAPAFLGSNIFSAIDDFLGAKKINW
jgi:uracil-DNA glycosylase